MLDCVRFAIGPGSWFKIMGDPSKIPQFNNTIEIPQIYENKSFTLRIPERIIDSNVDKIKISLSRWTQCRAWLPKYDLPTADQLRWPVQVGFAAGNY